MRLALAAALALAALLAGCGSEDETDAAPPLAGAPSGVVTVDEAVETQSDETLRVQGGLLADGEDVRLCSGFAESYPPQCARPSLVVEGLDLASVEGLEEASGVRWKENVTLTGTVRDGVLRVDG